MNTVIEIYGVPPPKNYYPSEEQREFFAAKVPTKAPFPLIKDINCGWELEVEGISAENVTLAYNKYPLIYCTHTEDGSLKDYGKEYIAKGPLMNEHLENSLIELNYINSLLKNGFNFTHRCSFHVHLNVADLPLSQVDAITTLYMLAEPLFMSYCENHRRGSSYCIPLNALQMTKKELQAVFHKETKYWAMSFNRITDLGTLEFRALHGTVNLELLFTWVSIIQSLKVAAKQFNQKISKILNEIATPEEAVHFLMYIFPLQSVQNKLTGLTREIEDSLFNTKYFLGNH